MGARRRMTRGFLVLVACFCLLAGQVLAMLPSTESSGSGDKTSTSPAVTVEEEKPYGGWAACRAEIETRCGAYNNDAIIDRYLNHGTIFGLPTEDINEAKTHRQWFTFDIKEATQYGGGARAPGSYGLAYHYHPDWLTKRGADGELLYVEHVTPRVVSFKFDREKVQAVAPVFIDAFGSKHDILVRILEECRNDDGTQLDMREKGSQYSIDRYRGERQIIKALQLMGYAGIVEGPQDRYLQVVIFRPHDLLKYVHSFYGQLACYGIEDGKKYPYYYYSYFHFNLNLTRRSSGGSEEEYPLGQCLWRICPSGAGVQREYENTYYDQDRFKSDKDGTISEYKIWASCS